MQTDYLKVGGKVYAVQEIQAEGVDIDAELREFYDQRHTQLADEFGQVLNQNMQEDWNTQIAHLRKFEDRGSIKVPENLFGKLVIVLNQRILPCRVVTYAPTEVSASIHWLKSRIERGKISFTRPIWSAFDDTSEVILKLVPQFHTPLVVAFDAKADCMYTPFQKTFHTMYSMNVCTGNHKASDFWKLSDIDLETQLNRINTFSPATADIRVGVREYSFSTIMTNDTIVGVTARENSQWRIQ
jgi:hypothetical protein